MIYRNAVAVEFMDKEALHEALKKAVGKAGNNQSRFARGIGASQQLVSYWLNNGRALPAEYVLPAEQAGFGSRFDIRPDIYPREAFPTQASAA